MQSASRRAKAATCGWRHAGFRVGLLTTAVRRLRLARVGAKHPGEHLFCSSKSSGVADMGVGWHAASHPARRGGGCGETAAVAVDRDRGQAAVRAPPKSDGGELQLERREAQSREMLQVELSGSRLVAEGGLLLATGIPAGMSVNVEFSGKQEGLVLGFASEEEGSMVDVELGELAMERFLACARCKMWWMTPEWGTGGGELPLETQFLLTEVEKGGPYAAYIPLIDDRFRSTLRPTRAGSDGITLRIDSGDRSVRSRQWRAALLVAAGPEPFALIDAAVEAAAALSGGAKPRRSKQLPPSLDSFGWCTWDAFYSSVSARDLATGLQALVDGGVPPRMLIIDDGWQLTDVDADEREAPTQRLLRMPDVEETQEDFINAENEMLAELMEVNPRPAYHTLTTAMPTLSNTHRKPLAHHHAAARSPDDADGQQQPPAAAPEPRTERHEQRQAPQPEPLARAGGAPAPLAKPRSPMTWLVSLMQKIAGWGFGLLEAAFVAFYLSCIDPAPHNSVQVRWFGMLAQGPLRSAMLQFYASSGDFTRRLCSVRANSKFASPDSGPDDDYLGAAPSDLKWVVSDLKRRFGLEWVYMWHGLPAYWSGVMPGEAEMAKYEPRLVYPLPSQGLLEIEPNMAWNPTVLAGLGMVDNPSQLYNDMHSYLRNAGVDGVKVDCQAGVGLIGSVNGGGPALGRKFHTALEASIRQKFPGNHCINCMCHSTENLFRMEDTVVARASDDFYPRDSASVTPHIAACAYNSVFLAPLLQPDWDMFQSKHPAAELHATARAISGAAIYVSDKPGQHDFELLRRLALPDGSILRPCGPCRPTTDSLFRDVLRDGASLLKVWNMNVHAGILAAFNLQGASWNRRVRQFRIHDPSPSSISAEMRPADIPHLHLLDSSTPHFGGRYVLRSDATGEATVADSAQESVTVTLASQKSDIVSVTPVSSCRGVDFAPLGLPGMMNAAGAIRDWKLRFSGGGPSSQRLLHCLEVLGCGELLLFCSKPPSQVLASAAPGAAVVALPCISLPKPQLWRVQLPQQAGLRHHLQIAF